MSLLENKTVIVTGVGSGLGVEVATSVLAAGANVVVAARSADKLAATAKELEPTGERILAHSADIGDQDSCHALAAAAIERFGSIDAVVQVAANEDAFGGVLDADLGKWASAYETNVLGSMKIVRAVAPSMKSNGGGSVVLIGSQSSFKPSMTQAGYAASKGALMSAMYYLADELGPDNIRVNMVVPSWMWGPNVEMYVDYRAGEEKRTRDDVLHEIAGKFPMRRMAEDGEVADTAVFFCSDLSRAITGQHLMVNCGEMMA